MPDTKSKFIYVNGDSFAAGVGSYDSEFVPEYEEHLRFTDIRPIDNYHEIKRAAIKHTNLDPAFLAARELEGSWPTQLSRILDVEIINSGEGASSMESILFRTMLDLSALSEAGRVPEVVLVQLTSPDRYALMQCKNFTEKHSLSGFSYAWIKSFLMNYHKGKLTKSLVELQSSEDLLVRFLLHVALLNFMVKGITGKEPVLLATYRNTCELNDLKIRRPIFTSLVRMSKYKKIPSELINSQCGYIKDKLPCGHFGPKTAVSFATGVANYLKENYGFE